MTKYITIDASKLPPNSVVTFDADADWQETKHPRGQPGNAGQFSSAPGGGKGKKAPYLKMKLAGGQPGLHDTYGTNASLNKIQNLGMGPKSKTQKIEGMKKYLVYNSPGSAIGQHVKAWVNHLEGHDNWSPDPNWVYGQKSGSATAKAAPTPPAKPAPDPPKPTPAPVAAAPAKQSAPSSMPVAPNDSVSNTNVTKYATSTAPLAKKLEDLTAAVKYGSAGAAKYAQEWLDYYKTNPNVVTAPDPPVPTPAPTPTPAAKSAEYKPVVGSNGMSVHAASYIADNPEGLPAEKLKQAKDTLTDNGMTDKTKKIDDHLKSNPPASTHTPPASTPAPTKHPTYNPVYDSPDKNVPLAVQVQKSDTDEKFIVQSGLADSPPAYLAKMGHKTIKALRSYSGSMYKSVNNKFRSGTPFTDEEQDAVDGIDAYLNTEKSRLPRDVQVFRGTQLPAHQVEFIEQKLKEGKVATVYNSGYNSTSLGRSSGFWSGSSHRFAITVKVGQHVAYMNYGATNLTHEYELLVRRGAPMRITGKVMIDGQLVYNAVIGDT